jgi:hypothetical protein
VREKLNENPIAQVALIAILVVVAVVMFIGSSGGGEESEEASAGETVATVNGVTATGSSPGEAVEGAVESLEEGAVAGASAAEVPASVPAPSPPKRLTAAYESGKTVALLIVDKGGIDSAFTARSSLLLAPFKDVSLFIVSAKEIARYAAITVGLDVNRVPALVVMKPKKLSGGTPQATVDYGIQTPQTVVQAVLDANYHGREVTYHPG